MMDQYFIAELGIQMTPKYEPLLSRSIPYRSKLAVDCLADITTTEESYQWFEKKYKTNLMNVMGSGEGGMPALTVMLDITHAAMKAFEHGIKKPDVIGLFGKYEEEGGSQLEFYTKVYMNIFAVSGFFSNSLTEQMQDSLEGIM